MNESIKINIDIDLPEIRELHDILVDLVDVIRNVANEMNSRSFDNFDRIFNTIVATLALFGNAMTQTIQNLTNFAASTAVIKVSIGAVTREIALLKIALKALPFAIPAAIGGAFGGLGGNMTRVINEMRDAYDVTGELTERTAILNNRMEESARRHEGRTQAIINDRNSNQELIGRLRELQGQETMMNAERVESVRIARELNQRIDELNFSYDKSTGFLDANSLAVLDMADHYERLAYTTEMLEESQVRLNEITEEYATIDLELELLSEQYLELSEHIDEFGTTLYANGEDLERIQARTEELRDEKYALREETEQLKHFTTLASNQMANDWDELAKAMEISNAVMTLSNSLAFETMTESQQAVVTGFQSMYEIGASRLGDLTRAFEVNSELTWEAVQSNQDKIIEATAEHTELYMQLVNEGFSEAYLRAIGADQLESLPLLRGMMDDNIDEVRGREQEWLEAHQNNADTILEGFEFTAAHEAMLRNYMIGGIRDTLVGAIEEADFPKIGESLPDGLINGIEDLTPELLEIMKSVAESLGITIEELLEINSPSRVFKGYGENIIQGMCNGLEDLREKPIDRLTALAKSMRNVYKTASSDYQNIGRNIINGLNQGLLNGENTVMATARRIAANIARTMRDALDINSPSRVMREQIGRHIPSGVAAGIDKYAGIAINSVDKLASDMVKITIPSVESMIGMRPSLSMAGVGSIGSSGNTINDNYTVYNKGLFDGATINWSGEEDIRRTMEKIAWATEQDKARMW